MQTQLPLAANDAAASSQAKEMPDWVRQAAIDLAAAKTTADIAAVLKVTAEQLGFEHYTLGTAIVNMEEAERRLIISSAPQKFLKWYDENELASKDPVVTRAYNTTEPFFTDVLDMSPLQKIGLWFVQTASGFGIAFALSAQIHGHSGLTTICNFSRGDRKYPADSVTRRKAANAAKFVIGHAHLAVSRVVLKSLMAEMTIESALTEKERKCLEMLAKGHTIKDVSARLGVAKASVNNYMTRAMDKLQAWGGREHAIAKAISRNEINVAMRARTWGESNSLIELTTDPTVNGSANPGSIEDILVKIESATDRLELADAALAAARWAHCTQFCFVSREPDNEESVQIVLSNYRGELLKLAADHDHCAHNPMVGGSRPRTMPFRWDNDGDRLAEDEAKFVSAGMERVRTLDGPTFGASSMNLSPDGALSVFSVVRPHTFTEEEWLPISYGLFLFARAIHNRAQAFAKQFVKYETLADRELECLQLLATGKGYDETASEMKCSPYTIRYYVERICKAFGVDNIDMAKSIAIHRNLLRKGVPMKRLADAEHFLRGH